MIALDYIVIDRKEFGIAKEYARYQDLAFSMNLTR